MKFKLLHSEVMKKHCRTFVLSPYFLYIFIGRDRDRGAVLISPQVWAEMDEHECCRSRKVWMTGKLGIMKYM